VSKQPLSQSFENLPRYREQDLSRGPQHVGGGVGANCATNLQPGRGSARNFPEDFVEIP
jgi:hypothetical protein